MTIDQIEDSAVLEEIYARERDNRQSDYWGYVFSDTVDWIVDGIANRYGIYIDWNLCNFRIGREDGTDFIALDGGMNDWEKFFQKLDLLPDLSRQLEWLELFDVIASIQFSGKRITLCEIEPDLGDRCFPAIDAVLEELTFAIDYHLQNIAEELLAEIMADFESYISDESIHEFFAEVGQEFDETGEML